jgi:hypothetical protein
MDDLRALVRDEMARAGSPSYSFNDLGRRRDRRRRNQRIAAGVVGIAVFVVAIWIVTSVGSFDRTRTPAVPGASEIGPTETGPSVAPDPDAEGLNGLPPEGATPSTPESGELVVELNGRVWVYADGRVISSVYDYTLEPYSGLVEQHLTPEGVEFLRSSVLSTGLFEHDLELAREELSCCLDIRVRDGDRLVSLRWGPRYALSDHQAPIATPEQATALQSLYALLTRPASWPASVWTDQQIRAYVPTSYSFCSRWAEPSRVLALLPEPARDFLGAGYLKTDGSEQQVDCSQMTTEEARTLAGILDAAGIGRANQGPWLRYLIADPQDAGREVWINFQPVLPHGESIFLGGPG